MFFRVIVKAGALLATVAATLLVAAGDPGWPEAWIFLAETAAFSLALGVAPAGVGRAYALSRRSSPMTSRRGPLHRLFAGAALVAFLGWLGLMALDARRFGWSETSVWCELAGLLLIAVCMAIFWRTLRSEMFASPDSRSQSLRNHKAAANGPYRFVRHPLYAGALLYFLGAPLLLGSWCGLALFPLFAIALGARAVGEERMLRSKLTDYDIYLRNVRYRFVPYVW